MKTFFGFRQFFEDMDPSFEKNVDSSMNGNKTNTDDAQQLDYFAALAMQSLIQLNPNICFEENIIEPICFTAIEFSKEMIKQLDNEQI